jgi:transposase
VLKGERTEIVIESSSTWYHAYELLSKSHHVILSNPVKTKAIASAKVKTDKVDALTLANLLRGRVYPRIVHPTQANHGPEGEMVRYRASLVRMRISAKNKVHSVLLMNGIRDRGQASRSRESSWRS